LNSITQDFDCSADETKRCTSKSDRAFSSRFAYSEKTSQGGTGKDQHLTIRSIDSSIQDVKMRIQLLCSWGDRQKDQKCSPAEHSSILEHFLRQSVKFTRGRRKWHSRGCTSTIASVIDQQLQDAKANEIPKSRSSITTSTITSGARGVFIGYKRSATTQQTAFGRTEPPGTEFKEKNRVLMLFDRHWTHVMPNEAVSTHVRDIFSIRLTLHSSYSS
jgi:hypothetical protein